MMSGHEAQAHARVRRHRVPRLGAPAGLADGRRGRAGCARCDVSAVGRIGGRRTHRRRRPRDGPGRECRRRWWPPASVGRGRAERVAARRRRGARSGGGTARLPRPLLGALALVPLSRVGARPLGGARGQAGAPVASPDRSRRARRRGGSPPGRARLSGVHADGDAARVLLQECARRRLGAGRRPARLHDHGGQLPETHGANVRGDDARARRGRAGSHAADCSTAGRVPRPASPHRRGASTSSESTTDEGAWLRSLNGPSWGQSCALPRRALRPRRHAHRFRPDHPGLDGARRPHRDRARAGIRGARGNGRRPGSRGADAGARPGPRRRARRGVPSAQRTTSRDPRGVRGDDRACSRGSERRDGSSES